jgi:hypothetical protein
VARIYAGDLSKIDPEALERVKELPDDFWVFAEFSIGRNIDWFLVREVPDGLRENRKSTMILTEVKRLEKPLRGTSIHASWEESDATGQWQEIICSNRQDRNYYWQAVNTANELSRWLWNNSPVFRPRRRPAPGEEFKVWPDLLLLGYRPETPPRLPIRPETGYGQWWFDSREWLRHVEEWFPKIGVPLTAEELNNLADTLHLEPVASPPRPVPVAPRAEEAEAGAVGTVGAPGPGAGSPEGAVSLAATAPAPPPAGAVAYTGAVAAGAPEGADPAGVLGGFLSLVGGLVQRVETLEARAAALERRLDELGGGLGGGLDDGLSAARPGGSAPLP